MELNAEGFYKKPRVISGMKFLSHITETRKCGNRMPVYFQTRGTIDVIDYRINFNDPFDDSVRFVTEWGKNDIWLSDISEWEFVQYFPNTQWTAVKIEKEEEDMEPLMNPEKTLDAIDFQDFYIKETFDRLKEVVVLYKEKFHTVLGMRHNLAKPGNYQLYLMRRLGSTIQKVDISSKQQFEYYKNDDAWSIEPTEILYTEVSDIKPLLRADEAKWVYVSGVKKKLKRVSEISDGLLHFVFANGDQIEHFYSTKNTRLRVREGKIATEYLLDHVKRMHV